MGLRRCCHPGPGARSPLYGVVAAAQQPQSAPQCGASVSPSRLSAADRTQRSPEIRLIGWRFFIAHYWSDGSEGLAGAGEAGSRTPHCQCWIGAGCGAAADSGSGPGQDSEDHDAGCEPSAQCVCACTTKLNPEEGLHKQVCSPGGSLHPPQIPSSRAVGAGDTTAAGRVWLCHPSEHHHGAAPEPPGVAQDAAAS